jgi:hypothetical protein
VREIHHKRKHSDNVTAVVVDDAVQVPAKEEHLKHRRSPHQSKAVNKILLIRR